MSFFKRNASHRQTDEAETPGDDGWIDPELRLRTVRTAASTIAESSRQEDRIRRHRSRLGKSKLFFRKGSTKKTATPISSAEDRPTLPPTVISGVRRNVYVNLPLESDEVDHRGEPIVRYKRNKVRTTKYTILTFIPKNLGEQFRRAANAYFLVLVVIQLIPLFGATDASISWLPLAFIIAVTAIKDGIEDYRRAVVDEQLNTSAATKLGNWRNQNQPVDPRSSIQKMLGLNRPGKVTKGVRKLRSKEADEGRIVLQKAGEQSEDSSTITGGGPDASTLTLAMPMRLEQVKEATSEMVAYPPLPPSSMESYGERPTPGDPRTSSASVAMSTRSGRSFGVVDWNKRTSGTATWERTLWKKLEVGDIVLLRDNDQVPADIVVLSTSEPDGLCYLETKNLDGETNLKPRRSLQATSTIQSEEDIEHASFVLDSEPPHQNLYLYNGVLRYRTQGTNEMKNEPVSINELLLRGCSLRNTSWVVGLVLFTGADSKIILNGGDTPSKRSKIERETNFNVIMNFVFLVLMCLAVAIATGVIDAMSATSQDFFEVGSNPSTIPGVNAVINFASALILFQNIVPISLYISIEIVKTIQAYFIAQDLDMYYEPYDVSCTVKTLSISDDLGQIEYIFSDKTGTLTQNVMEFQKCSVNGVIYGEGVTEAQRGAAKRVGNSDLLDPVEQEEHIKMAKEVMLQKMTRAFKNRWMQPDKLTLISPQLIEDLTNESSPQRGHIIAMFRALAICHSVLADKPEPQMKPYHLEYKAESPDEAALVAAARDVGFPFLARSNTTVDIEVAGQAERYSYLKLLEFNSTRKRMSIIVRTPDGKIVLYTKGADSVIYARLAANQDPVLKAKTQKDMEEFANSGLRTLCIAYRTLNEEEYFDWSRMYDAAAASVKDRDEAIEKANEQIEHSLHILGATALEDKLQDGVPQAIETLHQAGIKLWILTGDKLQTAIEIGFSCNLLKQDMDILIISAETEQETRAKIEAGLNKIASVLGPISWNKNKRGFLPGAKASFAVVIDGDTLRYALESELKPLFLNLATQCETVVCCRVSPAQKAQVVKLVKEGRNAMTLSIGDGANDVAMIQEANIGCGLFGLEGSQAAMSADYAFGQFRFLTKLLIVHGRWSYMRVADMHGNFFYKNAIWTFAMFWYLFYSSFNATYLYDYTFILLYNLVFTSLPVIALGAFDQDINAKAALAFPQLYVRGIRGLEYTRAKFWLYMVDGLYQSVIVYFIPYIAWSLGLALSWDGRGIDSIADFGTTIAVSAILAANCYVGLNTRYWTVVTWIIVFGSTLVMIIYVAIYSLFDSVDFNDEVVVLYGDVTFWATVIISFVLCLAPRYLAKAVSSAFYPLDRDIVREMWVLGDLKDNLGLQHRRPHKNQLSTLESGRNVEQLAPMYSQPHYRSESEASSIHEDHPAINESMAHSPGSSNARRASGFLRTSGYHFDMNQQPSSLSSTPTAVSESQAGSSNLGVSLAPRPDSTSPWPSYYSPSDIPTTPVSPRFQYGSSAIPMKQNPPIITVDEPVENMLIPLSSPDNEKSLSHEMHVRSPPSAFSSNFRTTPPTVHERPPSHGTEASHYATASEGSMDLENEQDHWQQDRPESTYSMSGPHAL